MALKIYSFTAKQRSYGDAGAQCHGFGPSSSHHGDSNISAMDEDKYVVCAKVRQDLLFAFPF